MVRDVQQVKILPRLVCSLSEKNDNQSINQSFIEGQVDLVEGGGHHVVGDVQQVQILPPGMFNSF